MYLLLHLSFRLLHHSFLLAIEKKKPLDLKIAILGGLFVSIFCGQALRRALTRDARSEVDWSALVSLLPFFVALRVYEGIFSRLCFKLVL